MEISYFDNKLVINNYTFEFEYLVFGSRSSMDYDVMVNIPFELTKLKYHNFLLICQKLDNILEPIILKENKPINTSLAHWNKSGSIIWSQKGTISESNNAIVSTFKNHKQMYEICPLTHMIRDSEDKKAKLMAASRMIIGILTNARAKDKYIYQVINKIYSIKEVKFLNKAEKNRFLVTLFKIRDIKTSTYNVIVATSDNKLVVSEYNKLKTLRAKLTKSLANNNIVKDYKQLYEESDDIVNNIIFLVEANRDRFDVNFLTLLNEELSGSKLSLKNVIRAVLISKYACFRQCFLEMLDLNKISLVKEKEDKLKKIAFQLGQTLCLINGIEVYEKETISDHYPQLAPFLFRQEAKNYDEINSLLKAFITNMEAHLERTAIETIHD
jgi:hypothetical protein